MNISNENKLLLYCAQTEISEVIKSKVKKLLRLPLNWDEVLESAFWHCVSPLLYNNLKDIHDEFHIPRESMDRLKAEYHRNLARNTYIYKELKRILDAFYGNRIDVIVLKGAALAKFVYGNIGLRPMADIDIMVRKDALPQAEKTLSGLGYLFSGNMPSVEYRKNHQEIVYLHDKKNIPVEIHWHVSNKSHPSQIRINDSDIIVNWWKDANSIELYGSNAFILNPEDLILHLCLHFLKHRFCSLNGAFSSRGAFLQMCDIYQTIKCYKNEIDWERFKCNVEKYSIVEPVHTTLFIINKFLGKNDDMFHDSLNIFRSERLDKGLVELFIKRIFIKEKDLVPIPLPFIKAQLPLVFKEKIKILLKNIFPNSAVISKRYNVPLRSKKLYFYYLIRPLSLLLRYRRTMLDTSRIKEEVTLNRWIDSKF